MDHTNNNQTSQDDLNLWLIENLHSLVSFSCELMNKFGPEKKIDELFQIAKPFIQRIFNFDCLSFLIVKEDFSFDIAFIDQQEKMPLIEQEIFHHIESGNFGWALNKDQCVLVTSPKHSLILHSVATRKKLVGLFVGLLPDEHTFLPDSAQKFISLILLRCAEEIENQGLIFEITKANQDLEFKVATRTKELKQSQMALFQSQKMESLGRLAGGVAHEFNNILAAILGYATLLKKKTVIGESEQKKLDIIISATERGSKLTKDMLAYARKNVIEAKECNLNEKILETIDFLNGTIRKNITLKHQLTDDLYDIKGDESYIVQALINLGINASHAIHEAGEIIFETTNFEATELFCNKYEQQLSPGPYVRVSITDTGSGIPKNIQDQIFDPFFSTKGVGKGTGLGLAMVEGMMLQHKGIIRLYSEENVGTTFYLYFPAIINSSKKKKDKSEIKAPIKNFIKGKKILVVDDEENLRTLAVDILSEFNCKITQASNGYEALSIFKGKRQNFDLILMDVDMPVMDGLKAYQEIRSLNPDIKVLFISGYAHEERITKITGDHHVDFMQKPFSPATLSTRIQQLFSKAGPPDHPQLNA